MYFGPSDAAEEFFAKMGHELPPKTNIADFMLDVLEDESFNSEEFSAEQKRSGHLSLESINLVTRVFSKLECRPRPSLLSQTLSNVHREALCIKRDPLLYTARCVAFLVISVFFGLVYIKSADRTQEQTIPRLWLIM